MLRVRLLIDQDGQVNEDTNDEDRLHVDRIDPVVEFLAQRVVSDILRVFLRGGGGVRQAREVCWER